MNDVDRTCESHRLILLDRKGNEVLVIPCGERLELPEVTIPRGGRVADDLALVVDAEFGERIVCLFQLNLNRDSTFDSGAKIPSYQVAQRWDTVGRPRRRMVGVPIRTLTRDSFLNSYDHSAVLRACAECKHPKPGTMDRPFAQLDWFQQLRDWVESIIQPLGIHLTAGFRQLHASACFALIRMETSGPSLWFKATGKPNQRELSVTAELSRLFPESLPPLLATRLDWNGWLSREVEGSSLGKYENIAAWVSAASAFSKLQAASIDRGGDLRASAARDLRIASLAKRVRPLIELAGGLMQCQAKTPPHMLQREDLLLLEERIYEALATLQKLGVPDCLGHLDLNPENIILSPRGPRFLDWAEAYVGPPFFSFEYLREHFRRVTDGNNKSGEAELRGAYLEAWAQSVPRSALEQAMHLSPLLAVFAYATAGDTWTSPETFRNPELAAYFRSLIRRMHREATESMPGGVTCQG